MDEPTPILSAVYRGQTDELSALLAAGPKVRLFEAAALGDATRVRELAAADRAAIEARSPDGWPPLHLAAHFGHGDAVDALLESRADVGTRSSNHEHNMALHAALAGRGDARIVSRLLACGADVNARAAGGHTIEHRERVMRPSSAARNDDGQTPLDIAQAQGHAALARRLRGELP